MSNIVCKKEISLSEKEISFFDKNLKQQKLSRNIFNLFNEWVSRSTSKVSFFYLKVFQNNELIGIGLFLKIKPFDFRTSYSKLRKHRFLNKLFGFFSKVNNNCVYLSFRNLITSNITRPFFYKSPELEDLVMHAILTYLKEEKEADMVTLIDTSINDNHYGVAGFEKHPSSSEAFLDVSKYKNIADFLDNHRSLKKNLRKGKDKIITDIQHGPISNIDQEQMKDCLNCSVRESRINTPSQNFFENNIFQTDVFNSNKYVHICIRVDNKIIGFHSFQVSGSIMGGVLGGFNRIKHTKSFAYERVFIASLEYALENKIDRVHYSLVDNFTKLRLADSFEPCGLYFYSTNSLNRKIFKSTFKHNDIYKLYQMEKHGVADNKKKSSC